MKMKKGYIFLVVVFFLYGSLYVANKFLLQSIPTFTLLLLRQLIAIAVLGIFAYKKGLKKIKKEHIKYFLLFGALGYFVAVGLQTLATTLMNASLSALLNSINPIFISVFAVIILKEKMTVNKIIGMCLSLIGVVCVIGISGDGVNIFGILFSVISVALWSLSSVFARKVSTEYSSEQLTVTSFAFSVPFYVVASIVELQHQTVTFTPKSILIILYLGVLCTGLGYFLWNRSLSMIDASICSLFYPLQPLFAAILGILILHEVITMNFVIGAVLISIGVVIGLIGKRKKKIDIQKYF